MFHLIQPTRTQLGDSGSDPFSEQEITGSPLSAEERETTMQVLNNIVGCFIHIVILCYLTCKAEYHKLSWPSIERVLLIALTISDILAYRFDNVFIICLKSARHIHGYSYMLYPEVACDMEKYHYSRSGSKCVHFYTGIELSSVLGIIYDKINNDLPVVKFFFRLSSQNLWGGGQGLHMMKSLSLAHVL